MTHWAQCILESRTALFAMQRGITCGCCVLRLAAIQESSCTNTRSSLLELINQTDKWVKGHHMRLLCAASCSNPRIKLHQHTFQLARTDQSNWQMGECTRSSSQKSLKGNSNPTKGVRRGGGGAREKNFYLLHPVGDAIRIKWSYHTWICARLCPARTATAAPTSPENKWAINFEGPGTSWEMPGSGRTAVTVWSSWYTTSSTTPSKSMEQMANTRLKISRIRDTVTLPKRCEMLGLSKKLPVRQSKRQIVHLLFTQWLNILAQKLRYEEARFSETAFSLLVPLATRGSQGRGSPEMSSSDNITYALAYFWKAASPLYLLATFLRRSSLTAS